MDSRVHNVVFQQPSLKKTHRFIGEHPTIPLWAIISCSLSSDNCQRNSLNMYAFTISIIFIAEAMIIFFIVTSILIFQQLNVTNKQSVCDLFRAILSSYNRISYISPQIKRFKLLLWRWVLRSVCIQFNWTELNFDLTIRISIQRFNW